MLSGQKESNASSEGLCARKFSITECSAYTEYLPDHEMNFSVKIYTKVFPSASLASIKTALNNVEKM